MSVPARLLIALVLLSAKQTMPMAEARADEATEAYAEPDDLLAHLVGIWDLNGSMGNVALHQTVNGDWFFGKRFLRLDFLEVVRADHPTRPYEALYVVAYDGSKRHYQLHLFDTFGAKYAGTVGFGERRGNSIDFLFDYPDGLFSNVFTFDPTTGVWTMLLRQRDAAGNWHDFARKTMHRR